MAVTIYIEAVIFLIIVFIFIAWTMWKKYSIKKALKKYKPENDKGYLAERERRRDLGLEEGSDGAKGLAELEGRSSIPPTVIDRVEPDSKRTRKVRPKFRNPFRRKH